MIEDLISEYDVLEKQGKIPPYGWDILNVPYALNIDFDGRIINIIHLGDHTKSKPVNNIPVPHHDKSSSNVLPHFLCDKASYLLADIDSRKIEDKIKKQGDTDVNRKNLQDKERKRSQCCFEASKALHEKILENVTDEMAQAIRRFFRRDAQSDVARKKISDGESWDNIISHGYLFTIFVEGSPALKNSAIRDAWDSFYQSISDDRKKMMSLVTGEITEIEKVHPPIKGIRGAQTSGAALISFNRPAFASYNLDQCDNAPLGKEEAYKYTTVLNTLIADDGHRIQGFGDTTILCWAQNGEEVYRDAFAQICGQKASAPFDDQALRNIVGKLAKGEACKLDGHLLDPGERFYILGLTPNAARLSVSFYFKNTFGFLMGNINKHYSDSNIDGLKEYTSLWALLYETVNPNLTKKVLAQSLIRGVMDAVLKGYSYPRLLLTNTELRIHAERKMNQQKAAILKAYYLRQKGLNSEFKEILTVSLNEESKYKPYVLGRLFSLYEQVQEGANPSINTTIRDKYFNSAAATPARIFPVLGKLSQKHLRKEFQYKGKKVFLEKQIEELSERIGDRYPEHLSMIEQGAFQLGYYFENNRKYKKNENLNNGMKESTHE